MTKSKLRKRKTQRWLWLVRTLVIWASGVLGLMLMVWLLPGAYVSDLSAGILFVLVVGILNTVFWPLLSRVFLPFMVYTLGLGALLLNGLIVWLAGRFVAGVVFEGFWTSFTVAIGMTVVTLVVSAILTINDDAAFNRNVLRRKARRARKGAAVSAEPGVIFLEIDGLAEPVFRRATEKGYMPTLSAWIERGSHRLMAWETDTSCQTGGCQAGILHGHNEDIPAFRWVEKENNNRLMTSTGPWDAPLMEERIADGNGLLAKNGYSRANLFSGDAMDAIFTYSRIMGSGEVYTPAFYNYFSKPYNATRTLVAVVWDIVLEIRSRLRQKRENVYPQLGGEGRGGVYPIVRAFLTVIARHLNTDTLIGDIIEGKTDAIYVTYAAYDELAHHSGVEDQDSMDMLHELDKDFSRLEQAEAGADRRYQFVVLSDHGQSQGATFKQRYGLTLHQHIRNLLPAEIDIHAVLGTDEGRSFIDNAVIDVAENDRGITGKAARRVRRGQQPKRGIYLGAKHKNHSDDANAETHSIDDANVVVLASGNLGLVYFLDWPERMTYEQLNQAFPEMIPGLVGHEGVGFILVRSEEHGGMVIGDSGVYYLKDDRIEGKNPLANFRPRAAEHLRRTDSFNYVPDILVNSFHDPETDEGAAFEELIGYHGGMGGAQATPFILYPTEWRLDEEEIIGAEHVYRAFKSRMN